MSILLGPFEKGQKPLENNSKDDREFLVFGYQCRLYRNDEKATMENEELLLIPWMGDRSLMVDRYDVRNRFDDKAQFGLKSNLPQRMTDEEEEFEKLLDEERYLALGTDIMEEELLQEEQLKRASVLDQPGSYREVGFSYESTHTLNSDNESSLLINQPERPEHLSTAYADDPEEGGEYERPFRLFIPLNITTPDSQKLHAIIQRTALFVSRQGQQMEIIIKAKQRFNPSFSFLHHEDRLFPYYKHLLNCIKTGSYEPQEETADTTTNDIGTAAESNLPPETEHVHVHVNTSINSVAHHDDDESDSEDDGFELHPILRANMNVSKPKPDSNSETDSNYSVPNHDNSKFKLRTFKNIAYTINSAPSVTESNGTNNDNIQSHDKTEVDSGVSVPGSTDGGYTVCSGGYDPMLAYYQASQMYFVGVVPPPPNLQPVVDKTAEYVAKNGEHFESTIILKHLSDVKFDFLHPWNQYNRYYKNKVVEFKEALQKQLENAPVNMQRLNVSGAVKFKMEAKGKVTPKLEQRSVINEDQDDESIDEGDEQDTDPPLNKKPKVEELAIDNTIKQFLLRVKDSIY